MGVVDSNMAVSTSCPRSTVSVMCGPSLDYEGPVRAVGATLGPDFLGAAPLEALAHRCEAEHSDCAMHQFQQSAATYLVDVASSADLPQEDRTIAAWT